MNPAAVERWIIAYTGFRQEGRLSGLEKIQDAIHRQCHSDTTRVLLKSWKDSMGDLANRICNRWPEGHHPVIVLIGYSYGAMTAVLLARELQKRGLKIETMLLIDPVWRPYAWLPSFLSLFRGWEINVPENVRQLYAWHQTVDKPSGHKLQVSEKTKYEDQTLKVPHSRIDDDPTIFERALSVACPGRETA